MNFQLKLNEEKLQSLNGQLDYLNKCLDQQDIKEWEVREITTTKETIENEIVETRELIQRIKSL